MEEIKKIEVAGQQYGVADMLMRSVMGGNAQVIEWSHTHNMNDYKDAGTYRIKGERTGNPLEDNLPIINQGSGHTIEGILHVLDSSLTNGSGNSDDCTITQFLMLSNRVGGQEGDMYMRSAYGANKDSLTWKPWEKYQTNVEVGCVSDMKLLNPNNPTEILKHDSGMNHITDNGIYSGIYFGPKCMVGTGDDNWHISFQDATAIETFVMVVINNYAAASNARCITQIKFAVTNGGVFSMEKRSTDPGTLGWSQWESVGGGGSSLGEWESSGDNINMWNPVDLGRSNKFGNSITIGSNVEIDAGVKIKGNNLRIHGYNGVDLFIGTGIGDSSGVLEVKLGNQTYIGEGVNITNSSINTAILEKALITSELGSIRIEPISLNDNNFKTSIIMDYTDINFNYIFDGPPSAPGFNYFTTHINSELGIIEFRSLAGSRGLNIHDANIMFVKYDSNDKPIAITKLPYGLTIEPSEDGNKLLISYNGKTAELQLT